MNYLQGRKIRRNFRKAVITDGNDFVLDEQIQSDGRGRNLVAQSRADFPGSKYMCHNWCKLIMIFCGVGKLIVIWGNACELLCYPSLIWRICVQQERRADYRVFFKKHYFKLISAPSAVKDGLGALRIITWARFGMHVMVGFRRCVVLVQSDYTDTIEIIVEISMENWKKSGGKKSCGLILDRFCFLPGWGRDKNRGGAFHASHGWSSLLHDTERSWRHDNVHLHRRLPCQLGPTCRFRPCLENLYHRLRDKCQG